MKNLLASLSLITAFVLNPLAWAEDSASDDAVGVSSEGLSEGSADGAPTTFDGAAVTSEYLSNPFIISVLDPETIVALLSTAGALMTTGYLVMKWHESETRRRYADAAGEAKTRLTAKDPAPITNAEANGSLRLVAQMEQKMLERDHPDIKLNELQVAALIIAHGTRLEAR